MFTILAERITKPQGANFNAAWRDPNNSVIPSKVDMPNNYPAPAKRNTANTPSVARKRRRPSRLTEKRNEALPRVKQEKVTGTTSETLAAYNAWLKDYLLQGNKITHFYDYPFTADYWDVVGGMGNVKDKSAYLSNDSKGTYSWQGEDKKAVATGYWVPAYTNTIDRQMMLDESVPKKIRRDILKGVAEEESGSRASNFRVAFREIEYDYHKRQMQEIIDTGKVRYATYEDFYRHASTDGKIAGRHFASSTVVYVSNPSGVTFPETYGARSLTILLDRAYDVNEWKNSLVHWWDHSTIVGYSKGKLTYVNGINRPHNPAGRDGDSNKMALSLEWYVASRNNSDALSLEQVEVPMFVDFSKGDGYAFKTFLDSDSSFYHFKDEDPAKFLADLGAVKVTFVAKDCAVVTADRRSQKVSLPLICLTAATPMSQDLTGYTYTVSSVEPGGVLEPAMVTFLRN